MTAPLRGTQSLVGQMGWVTGNPLLVVLEVAWRWTFGIPFLLVCQAQAQKILAALPPSSAGLSSIDPQNPWVAATQIEHTWSLYRPHVSAILVWLTPLSALSWIVVSALGRSAVFVRLEPAAARSRPWAMMFLQACWLALFSVVGWGWLRAMGWVAATHIATTAEPDLVGYASWAIFLALTFFILWALISWVLAVSPIIMLMEDCSPLAALGRSLRLNKQFIGKLIEINLVMGIVNLALVVLAMVLSAAPLPFSDQLGSEALHDIGAIAVVFYMVASDYFQLVRLKGFIEFWKMFHQPVPSPTAP
jgi:hypothetical protein